MYFLVYLVPATGGSGFGVFCIVLIALALLFGAAFCCYTWLVTPIAITMALLESGSLWWILPLALAVGAAVNLVSAKVLDGKWQPLLPMGVLLTLSVLAVVGVTIWQSASGITVKWYEWLLFPLGLAVGSIWLTLIFYPYLSASITLTSPVTLWMDKRPCLGALCSFLGIIGAAICLQGLCEGVIGWFSDGSDGSVLAGIRAQLQPDMLEFLTLDLVTQEKHAHIIRRMEDIIAVIARIPAWWRCLLGLGLAIGCGYGEFNCSGRFDMI